MTTSAALHLRSAMIGPTALDHPFQACRLTFMEGPDELPSDPCSPHFVKGGSL